VATTDFAASSPKGNQAVIRQQLRLAAKGNGPAQRAVIGMVHAIEQETLQAATATEIGLDPPITDEERAQAVLALLAKAGYTLEP
jgi:hypothetical protein